MYVSLEPSCCRIPGILPKLFEALNPKALTIVLATRNGGKFLSAQLDSLLGQSRADWTLLARDDHSSDDTLKVLEHYASQDERISILPPLTGGESNAAENFSGLLKCALDRGAEYVFCCDQDDVWAPNKLDSMMAELQSAEGPGRGPCLVHHDLRVVDESLKMIAPSLWGLMALRPDNEISPQRLLSRNEVTGCALACNKALLEVALPLPSEAIMHDWWLALFAGFSGTLRAMPGTWVSYRQHGANVIGAKSYRSGLRQLHNGLSTWQAGNTEFLETVKQARAFRTVVASVDAVDANHRLALQCYCELPRMRRRQRMRALWRCAVWRRNLLLDIVLVIRVILLPREPM